MFETPLKSGVTVIDVLEAILLTVCVIPLITILSPAINWSINLVLEPVTKFWPELIAIVPANCWVLDLFTTANREPSYCQNIPFWSSNIPALTVAPCHLKTLIWQGLPITAVVLPKTLSAIIVNFLSSIIEVTV